MELPSPQQSSIPSPQLGLPLLFYSVWLMCLIQQGQSRCQSLAAGAGDNTCLSRGDLTEFGAVYTNSKACGCGHETMAINHCLVSCLKQSRDLLTWQIILSLRHEDLFCSWDTSSDSRTMVLVRLQIQIFWVVLEL